MNSLASRWKVFIISEKGVVMQKMSELIKKNAPKCAFILCGAGCGKRQEPVSTTKGRCHRWLDSRVTLGGMFTL